MHVVNHFDDAGNGIVNVVVDLACAQARHGHVVGIASSPGSFVPLVQEYGVRHFELDTSPRPRAALTAPRRWRHVVRQFRPEIVHSHTPLAAALARTVSGYATVTTVHNNFKRSSALLAMADRVVAVSDDVAEALYGTPWFRRRPSTILNGVIGSPRRPAPGRTGVQLEQPAVVSVGTVSHRKGTDVLIRAFAEVLGSHPDAHVYLVGGNDDDLYRSLIDELGIASSVHATGFTTMRFDYLSQARVVVQPSRRDPFPLSLLEAKEAGKAIIGSRVDGIPQALDSGETGLLVTPGDPRELARAIETVLDDDRLRERLEAGSQESAQRYTVERMTAEYEELYEGLLDRRPRGSGRT
jgi:glycosyltransferase involved in cell wall biosynthesis